MGIRVKFTFNYYNIHGGDPLTNNCIYIISDEDYATKSPAELLYLNHLKSSIFKRLVVEYQGNNTFITYMAHTTFSGYYIYSDIEVMDD